MLSTLASIQAIWRASDWLVSARANSAGSATAVVIRRNPRGALAVAAGADESSLRAAIREILPTVMFSVAMKPSSG